ncbi:ribosome assembly RNA-binding protein YhbY [Pseudazoarcus pumilus]|uniref:Ribosome assembly RNA-binding protein YhbY n=1 Tax=Pseudazoarcus pumilus TaxID=2067960 RepID=A0A2I6SAV6_9RHOO|nr:ribosome assembly RNA-binding protein YhbY [Pseudazoarcus pumilus]AUN96384.1 ribosome assembly RNA-binding protein YhbY [Pseudazoarcus pumilus]
MIALTPAQRREFRAAAHHLKPVVTVADNGLSEAVLAEIDRSLQAHELIKVKTQGVEREQRTALMQQICDALEAAPVQSIGNILVVWRVRRDEDTPASSSGETKARGSKRASVAKSARAFAANARRTALMQAAAEKKRAATRRTPRKG